jgi:hypothetical protein
MNEMIQNRLLKLYIIYESLELFSIPEMTLENKRCFDLSVKAPAEIVVTLPCPVQFYYQCTEASLDTFFCGGGNRFEFIQVDYDRMHVPQSESVDWLTNRIFVDPEIEYDGDDLIYVLKYARLFHYYPVGKYNNNWNKCYGKSFSWY